MLQAKKTKVSVVIAAYNLEHCIEKSMESLQNQTLSDFEIIVCEDCSCDNTYRILQKIAESDSRITIIRNEKNSGQAYGRNRCFALARGEYIAIHDGDDYSLPLRLAKQAAFLDEHPQYAFAACFAKTIDDEGRVTDRPYIAAREVPREAFLWGLPFLHPTTMFRKSALEALGGYLVEEATRYRNEDYDLFMRMYAKGLKGYVMEERLYQYFEGSACQKRRKLRYRMAEAKVRLRNFRRLELMPKGWIYVIKPLIVGLIPQAILNIIRSRLYKSQAKTSKTMAGTAHQSHVEPAGAAKTVRRG